MNEALATSLNPMSPPLTSGGMGRLLISSMAALHAYVDETERCKIIPLGQILCDLGLISKSTLEHALKLQAMQPERRLGDILSGLGLVAPETLEFALDLLRGVPHVAVDKIEPEAGALQRLSPELITRYHALPLSFYHNKLLLACASLPDHDTLAELKFATQTQVMIALADPQELNAAINRHLEPLWREVHASKLQMAETEEESTLWREAERLAQQQPIVQLIDSFLLDAIHRQASDIHLRPALDHFDLLYRIDGSLIHIRRIERSLLLPVVSRIKIIARLNIAERRLPQDGHARMLDAGNVIDLRVSVVPTQHNESVVIRILNKKKGLRSVHEIGFSTQDEAIFRDLISRSNGLLLATGPTGSGKTTTLYAALQEVLKQEVNVVTVEDPVEYDLDRVRQLQLTEAINFGFPQALRHILRHDPDVIMIGEMRDAETAKMALESALTGHLVISTLHTNDASQAILRLQEMGMPAHLVKAALLGVIAQRLVRRNCPHCKAPEQVAPLVRRAFNLDENARFERSQGCKKCNHTGFSGRMMVYELMPMSDTLRNATQPQTTASELRQLAINEGMRSMLQHGLALAQTGVVSLTEVYQACM